MSLWNSDAMLLYFQDELTTATRMAQKAERAACMIERHLFPDGEIKLRLPETLPAKVAIFRTLNNPNDKLIELLLAAQTARSLGAKHLTLVAPYLAYMRQDMAFQPGEAISQRIVGKFLAEQFDAVITVDPHLHRITTLQQAVPVRHAVVLSGAPLLSDWIAQRRQTPLLIGPDEESAQWLALAAARHGFDHAVCRKVRHGDREVDIELPEFTLTDRQVVVFDDVVSTGHSVARAAQRLLEAGAASVDVAVTHALFSCHALDLMLAAGIGEIWSTDCIAHASNVVSMDGTLAAALVQLESSATL